MTATSDRPLDHPCPIQALPRGPIPAEWCFSRFAATIAALPDELTQESVLHPDLLLHEEGPLRIYYTPFDWMSTTARLILVGITPGKHQMRLAINEARRALRAGATAEEALRRVDKSASFAGPMRTNLVGMLDDLGVADALGLRSTSSAFDADQHVVATASVVSYTVVRNGDNYSGTGPRISESPIMRAFATHMLAANLAASSDALVIPLGRYAAEGVELCAEAGLVDAGRWLTSFPHPSGQNGHRKRLFEENYAVLRAQVQAWAGKTTRARRSRRNVPPDGLVVPPGHRWCPWGDRGYAFSDGRGHLVPIEGFGRGNGEEHGARYCSECKRARWGRESRSRQSLSRAP